MNNRLDLCPVCATEMGGTTDGGFRCPRCGHEIVGGAVKRCPLTRAICQDMDPGKCMVYCPIKN